MHITNFGGEVVSQTHRNAAVLYVRVSTDDQAEDPLNLENQEKRCRAYCAQRGLAVVEVFVDAGESARTNNRPKFQEMLRYCKAARGQVGYVVVENLSRFARNLLDQALAISVLNERGVCLRSTYESNIDETSAGKLATSLFGAINQFFSDSHSERQRDRALQHASAGRFLWCAPVGYVYERGKSGARIVRDPERAPFVARSFELMNTGVYKQVDALRIVTTEGFRTRAGRPPSIQTFQKMLRNPIYAGWIVLRKHPDFTPARGVHDPLISQETFDRVQAILDGRKPTLTTRKKFNPLLPLRHMVKCGVCGTPLTGALCKKIYPRYWCRKSQCRAVSLPKAKLEAEFVQLLARLRATDQTAAEFPKIAARVWEQKQGGAAREARRITAQLGDYKTRKRELIMMRTGGELTREEFEQANAELGVKVFELEEQQRALASNAATVESFVSFARLQLMDISKAWQIAGPDQRQRVQNLLFAQGLEYSPKSGFSNRHKCSLFYTIQKIGSSELNMVDLVGIEPTTSSMPWKRAPSCATGPLCGGKDCHHFRRVR
jgi:site-specific DNA recombinase